MAFLTQLTSQLGAVLRSQSAAKRLVLLALVGGTTVALIWLAMLAKTGSYTTLFTSLTPADAAEARMKLAQMGITAKLLNGGETIQVPARRVDEAAMLLALEGIPSSGNVGFELMDKSSIGQSKFIQEKNYHRMREGELARTLLTLQEVERARVHLALPEESVFARDQKQPTASVVLKLRRGKRLSDRQMSGIVHLVSHSIEGLTPDNVSIIDSEGNLLNTTRGDSAMQFTASQSSYKTGYEDQLKSRIESMLENIVGKGKVAARVTADFDFSNMRQVQEKYDPEGQVVRSEQNSVETRETGVGTAGKGPVGSDSNLPGAPPTATAAADSLKGNNGRSDSTKEYALSREWKEVQSSMPKPEKVSVALLVDGVYEEIEKDGKKTQEYRPRNEEEISKLEELVKAAMGYTTNEVRQDVVTVECLPFKVNDETIEDSPGMSFQMRQMIELGVTWGIVGLIGLLLIMFVLRPAVKHVMVARAPMDMPMLAMPNQATVQALAAAGIKDTNDPQLMEKLQQSGVELPNEMMDELRALENQLGAKDRQFNQMLQMNQLQAKSITAQSQKVHKDVIESAKGDPQRTVSLMRQWMDEA